MNRRFITLALFAILNAGSVRSAYPSSTSGAQEQQKQPKSPPKETLVSMTGCVDEQDGHYVLIEERERTTMANLEADGFPTEGFAKHMGHKVTVRGTANSDKPIPVFKVRSVDTISETCAPQR
jgi:hypothetical protein